VSYHHTEAQLQETIDFHAAVVGILLKKAPGRHASYVTALAALTDLRDRLARGERLHNPAAGSDPLLDFLQLMQRSSLGYSAGRRRRCSPHEVADILILAARLPDQDK